MKQNTKTGIKHNSNKFITTMNVSKKTNIALSVELKSQTCFAFRVEIKTQMSPAVCSCSDVQEGILEIKIYITTS